MRVQDVLIKVDLDGVIRDWNQSLITEYKKRNTGRVVYPFSEFKLQSAFPDCDVIGKFYEETAAYDIYRNAKPYAGAIEFVELLIARYPNVWLVTTQYANTMFPTIEWVQTFIPSHGNLPIVFSKEKGLIGQGKFAHTILIDDAPHNLESEVRHGGTAVCFGQLYNFNNPDHNKWLNFFGDTDFSLEAESERIKKQYQMILDYLPVWFEKYCVKVVRLNESDCSCWGDHNGMVANPQCLLHGSRK